MSKCQSIALHRLFQVYVVASSAAPDIATEDDENRENRFVFFLPVLENALDTIQNSNDESIQKLYGETAELLEEVITQMEALFDIFDDSFLFNFDHEGSEDTLSRLAADQTRNMGHAKQ